MPNLPPSPPPSSVVVVITPKAHMEPRTALPALRQFLSDRERLVKRVVETIAAEPPAKPWYLWVLPILVSTGLVAIALLFGLIQDLLNL